ncbi:nitrate reductase molybdenum cofactor assembly chaperone [Neisseriaceae bacterium ESL0693]|nr:nitrate reductase molybdenum cofactor assembly chaperone [Neisseriaceae bacterium ESL0693]
MLKILSLLLSYPQQQWLSHLAEIEDAVAAEPETAQKLQPLFDYLHQHDEIELQENYVATFDRNRNHALHLFEHLHGEDRARGQAMVDLLHEYQNHGFEPRENELPDYLPLFLEFLAQIDADEAKTYLADAVHVIAYIAGHLRQNQSVYAPVLEAVVALSPVAPEPLQVAPVRDMDEAMERFGTGADGVEPLLRQSSEQPVQFFSSNPTK